MLGNIVIDTVNWALDRHDFNKKYQAEG